MLPSGTTATDNDENNNATDNDVDSYATKLALGHVTTRTPTGGHVAADRPQTSRHVAPGSTNSTWPPIPLPPRRRSLPAKLAHRPTLPADLILKNLSQILDKLPRVPYPTIRNNNR